MDAGYDPNIGYLPFEERPVAYMPYEQVPERAMPPIPQPHYSSHSYGTDTSWDTKKMMAYFGISAAVVVSIFIVIAILNKKGGG